MVKQMKLEDLGHFDRYGNLRAPDGAKSVEKIADMSVWHADISGSLIAHDSSHHVFL